VIIELPEKEIDTRTDSRSLTRVAINVQLYRSCTWGCTIGWQVDKNPHETWVGVHRAADLLDGDPRLVRNQQKGLGNNRFEQRIWYNTTCFGTNDFVIRLHVSCKCNDLRWLELGKDRNKLAESTSE
jgi:hypothetical protein